MGKPPRAHKHQPVQQQFQQPPKREKKPKDKPLEPAKIDFADASGGATFQAGGSQAEQPRKETRGRPRKESGRGNSEVNFTASTQVTTPTSLSNGSPGREESRQRNMQGRRDECRENRIGEQAQTSPPRKAGHDRASSWGASGDRENERDEAFKPGTQAGGNHDHIECDQ